MRKKFPPRNFPASGDLCFKIVFSCQGTENGNYNVNEAGKEYLHIEGAFYLGIGCLFLLYGLYRAVNKPAMSLILTVISLGTRVALSYLLAPNPAFGVTAIWWSIPIGWGFADIVGILYFIRHEKRIKT